MDPEELAAALAGQSDDNSVDGYRAVNPQTGQRIIWRGNRRTGRWVEMSEATATPQAREALQGYRDEGGLLGRLAPMAETYVNIGNTTPTGGWAAQSLERETRKEPGDLFAGFNHPFLGTNTELRGNLDRLRGLEGEAVRANIRPGTSGASNSIYEQQVLRDMFPSTLSLGNTNSGRAAGLFVRRDLQQARIAAAEQWLQSHPDLSQFEAAWAQQEATLRPQLEARYSLRFRTPMNRPARPGTGSTIGAAVGAAGGQSAPQTIRIDRNGQVIP